MPKQLKIEEGQRFGKLTVIKQSQNIGKARAWDCICDCGNTKTAIGYLLCNGSTKSCGCLHQEVFAKKRGQGKPNKKLVCGVALLDVDYFVKDCPIYAAWGKMIRRCFDEKERAKNPRYLPCTTVDEWLLFSNFKAWAEGRYMEGLALDKDILVEGNKKYGPDTCSFVPTRINSLLTDRKMARGELPLGVFYMHKTSVMINERSKPYVARVKFGDRREFLGHFKTPEEAHKAWQIGKARAIDAAVTWWATQESFNTYCADSLLKRAWDLQLNASLGIMTEGF